MSEQYSSLSVVSKMKGDPMAMPHPSAISVALPPPRPTQNGDHEATRIRADSPKPFRRLSGEETQRPSPLVPSVAL